MRSEKGSASGCPSHGTYTAVPVPPVRGIAQQSRRKRFGAYFLLQLLGVPSRSHPKHAPCRPRSYQALPTPTRLLNLLYAS